MYVCMYDYLLPCSCCDCMAQHGSKTVSLRETLLNWFVRSKKMAAHVGSLLVRWGRTIIF